MNMKLIPKSVIPMSESKTQRSDCGGFGRGLGNNVSDVKRGVNANDERVEALDRHADQRRKNYANLRNSDAYKIQRAEEKRRRKSNRGMFQANDATEDKTARQKPHTPATPPRKFEAGSRNVAMTDHATRMLAKIKGVPYLDMAGIATEKR